ncbi:hypothetical protein GOBAR_DD12887 [Gossypium barbadense]|nr:hypothetical protein GOBAR_DD12887 [Gossypium barbadense]
MLTATLKMNSVPTCDDDNEAWRKIEEAKRKVKLYSENEQHKLVWIFNQALVGGLLSIGFTFLTVSNVVVAVKASATASRSNGEYKPVGPTEYRLLQPDLGKDDGARRRLAPFQLCLLCKCCSATAASTCTSMPCCFGIDCQLPNKPFGVCAFVPKTCNCNSCAA